MKARALVAVFVSASSCLAQQFQPNGQCQAQQNAVEQTVARYRPIFEGYSGTPSVRMEHRKTGQYPEFFCEDTWISLPFGGKTKGPPKCSVKWSDTFADVPVIDPAPRKAADLENRVAATRAQMISDTGAKVHQLFACYRGQVTASRTTASVQFTNAIAQLDGIVQSLRSQGADPEKVRSDNGSIANLSVARTEIITQRDKTMAQFDAALKELDDSERAAIDKLSAK